MGIVKRGFRKLCSILAIPFVQIRHLGKILDIFYQEYQVAKIIYTQKRVHQKLKKTFWDTTVKNGPFKGLIYPELEGVGSELYPKLLGCYEMELFDWIEKIRPNVYDKIVNIGCAEGYYAVGLSKLFPEAEVYAYDLAERARILCHEMGQINNVSERLKIFSKCTVNTLKKLDFQKRSLIVCDCEGFELDLFKKEVMPNIRNCDILIELHDFINPKISEKMLPLFQASHDLEIYRSIDDDLRLLQLNNEFRELMHLSDYEKKIALGELRPTTMEWAFLSPKKAISRKISLRKEVRTAGI